MFNKGIEFYNLEKYYDAQTCFDDCIKLKSNIVESYVNKTLVIFKIGKKTEALENIEKVREKFPDNIIVLDVQAYILAGNNKKEDALRTLDSATNLQPDNEDCWLHKGNIQLELKNYKRAHECYDKVIELNENFVEAHNNKAVIFAQTNNRQEAVKELRKAIEKKPSFSLSHENLIKLTISSEKNQDFLQYWSSSKRRQFIAISMIIFALGMPIYYPLFIGENVMEIGNITKYNNQEKIQEESIHLSKSTNSMSEYYFIMIGLVVFIILSPQIRRAKVGTLDLEFIDIKRNLIESELKKPDFSRELLEFPDRIINPNTDV